MADEVKSEAAQAKQQDYDDGGGSSSKSPSNDDDEEGSSSNSSGSSSSSCDCETDDDDSADSAGGEDGVECGAEAAIGCVQMFLGSRKFFPYFRASASYEMADEVPDVQELLCDILQQPNGNIVGVDAASNVDVANNIDAAKLDKIVKEVCGRLNITTKPPQEEHKCISEAYINNRQRQKLQDDLPMAVGAILHLQLSKKLESRNWLFSQNVLHVLNKSAAITKVIELCERIRVVPPDEQTLSTEFYFHDFDKDGVLTVSEFKYFIRDLHLFARQPKEKPIAQWSPLDVHGKPDAPLKTTLAAKASRGEQLIRVDGIRGFVVGDCIEIGSGKNCQRYDISNFHIEMERGEVVHLCIDLQEPLREDHPQNETVVAKKSLQGKDIDEWNPCKLVEGWVPREWVDEGVLKLLRNREKWQAVAKQSATTNRLAITLRDFDVTGPAVRWSCLSMVQGFLAVAYSLLAYKLTPDVAEADGFSSYPHWLWLLVFVAYIFHFFVVQLKVLKYVLVAQLQQLRSKVGLGCLSFKVSFRTWLALMFFVGAFDILDIASSSFLYGKFQKSYEINPHIAELWRQTVDQAHIPLPANMDQLFFYAWVLGLLQFVVMVLHAIPCSCQIDYGLSSMDKGYRTVMSYIMPFNLAPAQDNLAPDGNVYERRIFWHADIYHVMCVYGRLTALTRFHRDLFLKRLETADLEEGEQRLLQIYVSRMMDYCGLLLCVDILEKALKLEMQITIVAFAHALEPRKDVEMYDMARSCLGYFSLERATNWIVEYDWQIVLAVFLGLLSLLNATYFHIKTLVILVQAFRSRQIDKDAKAELKRARRIAHSWIVCYLVLVLMLGCVCLHCCYKLLMVFVCPHSVANIIGGCVELSYQRLKGTEAEYEVEY